ncbi:MAG: sodium:calcium antiporter, partial [Coriobacteriia bacterium]|nr:sodium:calcium antiporter [Coriobacteriia bacterium]
VGNVIGTNIANLCLVLGIAALASPIVADWRDVGRDVWVMLGATTLVPVALADGVIGRPEAALLVAALIAYVALSYRTEIRARTAAEDWRVETVDELAMARPSLYIGVLMCVSGAAGLVAGAELLVRGATGVAHSLGLSEALVGLTVVAAGTSAPELATCVVASVRGDDDIALGNAVGSNVFNILLILGVTGTFMPIDSGTELLPASILLLVLTAAFAVAVWRAPRIERAGGAVLLATYVVLVFAAFLG